MAGSRFESLLLPLASLILIIFLAPNFGSIDFDSGNDDEIKMNKIFRSKKKIFGNQIRFERDLVPEITSEPTTATRSKVGLCERRRQFRELFIDDGVIDFDDVKDCGKHFLL